MGHPEPVTSALFSPDESRVVTISGSIISIYDAATGTKAQEIDGGTNVPGGVAFSNDGTRIATWGDDGSVSLWDIASGLLIVTFDPATLAGASNGAVWSENNSVVMSWGADAQVHLWNVNLAPSF